MREKGILALAQTIAAGLIVLLAATLLYGASLQEEFDRICVYTQEAESLSLEKLQELLTDCDLLQKNIEQSNDKQKKVLSFRLKKCRDFFVYFIDLKQQENSSGSQ